jgi:two-component system CheB/CheR fusion protein
LTVRGDPARLQQIAGNLLTNAARYSPPGKQVILAAWSEDGNAVLSVKDQGDGISAELLPKIFELFVQKDQGLARSNGGLGVGLALVRQLAELHHGRVDATSAGPGRGSEFRVILPLSERPAASEDPGAAELAKRIVLVEDQDDAREMLKELLESRGYTVFEARTGKEAIEMVERVHPDAALIDIGLPVLDGYEVAKRLRGNPQLDDVVLVALTGYGAAEDVRAALAIGFTAHLTKPADPERINEVLNGPD